MTVHFRFWFLEILRIMTRRFLMYYLYIPKNNSLQSWLQFCHFSFTNYLRILNIFCCSSEGKQLRCQAVHYPGAREQFIKLFIVSDGVLKMTRYISVPSVSMAELFAICRTSAIYSKTAAKYTRTSDRHV